MRCKDPEHRWVVAGDAYTNCCDRALDRAEVERLLDGVDGNPDLREVIEENGQLRREVARQRELVAAVKVALGAAVASEATYKLRAMIVRFEREKQGVKL